MTPLNFWLRSGLIARSFESGITINPSPRSAGIHSAKLLLDVHLSNSPPLSRREPVYAAHEIRRSPFKLPSPTPVVPLLRQLRYAQHVKIRPTIEPTGAAGKAFATVKFPKEPAIAGSVSIDTLTNIASSLRHLCQILFLLKAAAA